MFVYLQTHSFVNRGGKWDSEIYKGGGMSDVRFVLLCGVFFSKVHSI